MRKVSMASKEWIRGTLRVMVLKLLSDNGRMYGYEITQRVKEITCNEIELTFGALYPTLHKLEAEGLVTTETLTVDHRERKYYSITKSGTEVSHQEVCDYFAFIKAIRLVLQ